MPANIRGIHEGRGGGPCAFQDRCVIDVMPMGSGVIEDGRWILVNEAWARLCGEDNATAMLSRPIMEWVAPEARSSLAAILLGHTSTAVIAFVTRAGVRRLIEVVATRMAASGGSTPVLISGRDVTEREEMAEQLRASDRLVSIGILASGVAHEVNNPLSVVMTNLELAAEDLKDLHSRGAGGPEVEALREELGDASHAAKRVRDIVANLRDLAPGRSESLEGVLIGPVIASVVRLARQDVERRAKLVLEVEEVGRAAALNARLGQVLLSLVDNAARSIPDGDRERHRVTIGACRSGGEVVISVADTGRGMSQELRERLFTPFFTTRSPAEGTGLSLALSLRQIESFGGRMTVASEPGKGSTFRVHLRPWVTASTTTGT